MVHVEEVAENIYLIDNRLFNIPKWGSVYLINETEKALIECGPTTSAESVLDGINQVGIRPEDISYIILTHIHLDHAGGAGVLVKNMPKVKVIAHYKAVRHLLNPANLVASAISTQGKEVMDMHGEVVPIDIHRIQAASNGDRISLGKHQTLEFIETPGHAPHHLCIYEVKNRGLFTGDAVAAYIAKWDILLPYHPPPRFDLDLCLSTLNRLEEFSACKIYYSHFGVSSQVNEHINRAIKKLMAWDLIIKKAIKEGTINNCREVLIDQARNDLSIMEKDVTLTGLYNHLIKSHIPMCVDGHIGYYIKTL